VLQYRPLGMRIWSEVDKDDKVVAWKIEGDYLRDTLTIWMDGRPSRHRTRSRPRPASARANGKATR
jgi:hypothetical protein